MSTSGDNPYKPPMAAASKEAAVNADVKVSAPAPAVAASNTVVPRYIAATIDNLIAMILAVLAAKSIYEDLAILQLAAAVAAYLGYYLLFEAATGRTPGKLSTGLIVIQFDGRRCSWRQALVRTAFRLLEVNPALLGALPAAVCIVVSKDHQRFGDRVAGTVVVPADRWRVLRDARRKSPNLNSSETTT